MCLQYTLIDFHWSNTCELASRAPQFAKVQQVANYFNEQLKADF